MSHESQGARWTRHHLDPVFAKPWDAEGWGFLELPHMMCFTRFVVTRSFSRCSSHSAAAYCDSSELHVGLLAGAVRALDVPLA